MNHPKNTNAEINTSIYCILLLIIYNINLIYGTYKVTLILKTIVSTILTHWTKSIVRVSDESFYRR